MYGVDSKPLRIQKVVGRDQQTWTTKICAGWCRVHEVVKDVVDAATDVVAERGVNGVHEDAQEPVDQLQYYIIK